MQQKVCAWDGHGSYNVHVLTWRTGGPARRTASPPDPTRTAPPASGSQPDLTGPRDIRNHQSVRADQARVTGQPTPLSSNKPSPPSRPAQTALASSPCRTSVELESQSPGFCTLTMLLWGIRTHDQVSKKSCLASYTVGMLYLTKH